MESVVFFDSDMPVSNIAYESCGVGGVLDIIGHKKETRTLKYRELPCKIARWAKMDVSPT